MPAPDPTASMRRVMAAASLGFAAAGLMAPRLTGRLAGVGPRATRLMAVRDLLVGAALLRSGPIGLAARGLSDAGDALLLARRRPTVSALAATSAVVNLVGARDALDAVDRRG